MRVLLLIAVCGLVAVFAAGCEKSDKNGGADHKPSRQVVVYTALDRGFSEPILDDFTKQTGIEVLAQYDTESTKSVGLANRLRAEKDRPRCDVYWNNEILNTLQLKAEGLLDACAPSEAQYYPAQWKDPEGYWFGFAARARVIIVNTEIVQESDYPSSIKDLADPKWKGQTGIAKPLFGTTASHVACLFAHWGSGDAVAFLDSLKANEIQIHGGNKGCATSVSAGSTAFALTDTDDAIIEVEAGKPVRIVYPDSDAQSLGTLFLPNTLSIVKNAPNRSEAEELINFLLSPVVEERLAAGPSAQIPLHPQSKGSVRVKRPGEVHAMLVDLKAASEMFGEARKTVEERFLD